jgi:DNA-binding MarR family transcriptional regulator
MSRLLWQWVRREIYADVLAAGFDDLNPAHVSVFRYPTLEGTRPSDLADEMQITKQSVNELLGHLERRGYLVREPDASDSRSKRIRLTERGERVEAITWDAAARSERSVAELIGERRLQELRRSLGDIAAQLGLTAPPNARRPPSGA